MRDIILLIHDIRSCHNVGSLLRTADGLGVSKVFITGYSPYPTTLNDKRLPHIHQKLSAQIHKTALGAENSVIWEQNDDVNCVIKNLRTDGYKIIALEQAKTSAILPDYKPSGKMALVIGREVEGIDQSLLNAADEILEIPMLGAKESLNVVQAAAIALYHLQFGA